VLGNFMDATITHFRETCKISSKCDPLRAADSAAASEEITLCRPPVAAPEENKT